MFSPSRWKRVDRWTTMLANCFTTESLCPRPPTSWYMSFLSASNTFISLCGCVVLWWMWSCVFQTDRPTVIEYDDHEYLFEGFSLFSHTPLTNVSFRSHVLKAIMKPPIFDLPDDDFIVIPELGWPNKDLQTGNRKSQIKPFDWVRIRQICVYLLKAVDRNEWVSEWHTDVSADQAFVWSFKKT